MNALNFAFKSINDFSKSGNLTKQEDCLMQDHFVKCFKFESKGALYSSGESMNIFLFFLSGSVILNCKYYESYNMDYSSIVTLPKKCEFSIEYSEGSEFLILGYDDPSSEAGRKILDAVRLKIDDKRIKIAALSIHKMIASYIELLKSYSQISKPCPEIFRLKKEELYVLLRCLYKDFELAHFFYPVLIESCSFRQYILDNYDKVSNVQELIDGLSISKSIFYDKFKQEFGQSAKQWLIERLKERILKRITDVSVTAKDIMYEFEFSSPEHLNTFCKKQFGLTPGRLIDSVQREFLYGRNNLTVQS